MNSPAAPADTDYEMVAGLEVHVQLKTRTKMFCGCRNEFGAEPNTRVCPVCLGHPGSLPVINEQAVRLAIRAGLVLNCEIASETKFDRKNYFYPDLPKGYQISQYDRPICGKGALPIELEDGTEKTIGITRAHLEEDAGKSMHVGDDPFSRIDLNRAGVPLLEIVSEPDIRSPEEAYAYLTTLKQMLQYAGISDCDMEKGSLRCDVNLSVRPRNESALGTKTEVKNLNSFKNVSRALEYERDRQIAQLRDGNPILHETRLFNADTGVTAPMRSKEEAMDYRYFPEPDLPPLQVADGEIEEIRDSLPEMPAERRSRFEEELGLPEYDAAVLTRSRPLADWFEAAAEKVGDAKTASNWVLGELARESNERGVEIWELEITPAGLAEIIDLVESDTISRTAGSDVLVEVLNTGADPAEVVKEKGLEQISDTSEIEGFVEQVIEEHPGPVSDFQGGKENAIKFLIGQVMRLSKGKANPPMVDQLFREKLSD